MVKGLLVALYFSFVLSGCIAAKSIKKKGEVHIASVNNNVCKKLVGDVVLYAIFVDSKYTNPWTEYDIYSTIDSIQKAMCWIEEKSIAAGISLNITIDYHQDNNTIVPVANNLSKKTLSATLFAPYGVRNIDRWADKIGNSALKTFGPDTSKITRTKIQPKNRERLIARLRDKHKTDNVALLYFINNYYKDEISVALHIASDDNPEYAVVSFKRPTVIAHEFLHLFGALDLYVTPFDKKKSTKKKKSFAMEKFPNEIMAFTHRSLDTLTISPFTKYLIGWEKSLSEEYSKMIIGKKINVAKY